MHQEARIIQCRHGAALLGSFNASACTFPTADIRRILTRRTA